MVVLATHLHHFPEERQLVVRKVYAQAVTDARGADSIALLAFGGSVVTQEHDGVVGLCGLCSSIVAGVDIPGRDNGISGLVIDIGPVADLAHDTLEIGAVVVGYTEIIAHHGVCVSSGSSGHVNVLDILAQGKEVVVVLEKDHGLDGGLAGDSIMLGASDDRRRDAVIRAVGVVEEDTEPELGHQQRLKGLVYVSFREEPAVDRLLEACEGVAALKVEAGLDRDGAGFSRVLRDMVAAVDVIDSPAV